MANFTPSSLLGAGYESGLIECPYNKSHVLLKHRMQTHLVKCRKNYPDQKKKQCPFNTTHVVNDPEFEQHIEMCPDRASLEQFKYNINTSIGNSSRAQCDSLVAPPIEMDECWDDMDVPTYNPAHHVESKNVIRLRVGVTPSERKAFRVAERIRLNNLNN